MKHRGLKILVSLSLALAGCTWAISQQGQQVPPLTVETIKGSIYLVKGGAGANTGFFIGDRDVVAIDAKMTQDSAKQMVAEIAKLTPLPVTLMILTHSDGDHVNGLTGFPKGIAVIAHEKTRDNMAEAFKDPKMAGLEAYLPTQTIAQSVTALEGLPIEILYFGRAHTSGDLVVHFFKDKVAFVGDLAFLGRDPLIHRSKNGTSFGLVRYLKELLKIDAQVFVPGHGDPLGKTDLDGLAKSIEEKQSTVKTIVDEGKTLDDIKKAFGVEEPAPGARRWPSLVEVIYLDLTEKK